MLKQMVNAQRWIFMGLLSLLVIAGCVEQESSFDNDSSTDAANEFNDPKAIEGTWRGDGDGDWWKITRNSDGTFSQDYLSTDDETKTYNSYQETGTWSLVNGVYTETSDDGDNDQYRVIALSSNEFEMRFAHSSDDDGSITENRTSDSYDIPEPPAGYVSEDEFVDVSEEQDRADQKAKYAGRDGEMQEIFTGIFRGEGGNSYWKIVRNADGTFKQEYLTQYHDANEFKLTVEEGTWSYADGVYTENGVIWGTVEYAVVAADNGEVEYATFSNLSSGDTVVENRRSVDFTLEMPAGYTRIGEE